MLDLVLVMSVTRATPAQASSRPWCQDRADPDAPAGAGSSARLEVDGGITPRTPHVVLAGADTLVAASAIFGHPRGSPPGLRRSGARSPEHDPRGNGAGRPVAAVAFGHFTVDQARASRFRHLAQSVFCPSAVLQQASALQVGETCACWPSARSFAAGQGRRPCRNSHTWHGSSIPFPLVSL